MDGGKYASFEVAEVLGMLHLHKEEFQLLARSMHIVTEEDKTKIWLPDNMTTARLIEVGS